MQAAAAGALQTTSAGSRLGRAGLQPQSGLQGPAHAGEDKHASTWDAAEGCWAAHRRSARDTWRVMSAVASRPPSTAKPRSNSTCAGGQPWGSVHLSLLLLPTCAQMSAAGLHRTVWLRALRTAGSRAWGRALPTRKSRTSGSYVSVLWCSAATCARVCASRPPEADAHERDTPQLVVWTNASRLSDQTLHGLCSSTQALALRVQHDAGQLHVQFRPCSRLQGPAMLRVLRAECAAVSAAAALRMSPKS